jgi:glutamyl-tRNA reductase
MHILVVGLNFKTAPVEVREKLSFDENDLGAAMTALSRKKSMLENVIVSTCNRTEIYAVVDQLHTGRYYIKDFLADWFQMDKDVFSPYLFIYEQEGAMEHLFKVICGLDSMVLGETQILGQVKDSFLTAQAVHTTGTIFNQLFKQAVTLAKKAHSQTEIGSNAVSVSYAAVELAKKVFGSLKEKHVLIIGAGKMGELAIENLQGSGATQITVINRTYEKARVLADRYNGDARVLAELKQALTEADILISSTAANEYVITRALMDDVNRQRKGSPLFMVDIAVPRDLDPEIAELESVFLYDIDDLEGIVQSNLAERQKAAEQINLMIESEIVGFNQWVHMLGVVPIIAELRDKAMAIQADTMKSIERKMPNLTERERKVLNKHTKSIVNQLLKDPVSQVKEIAAQANAAEKLELFKQIFNLSDQEQNDLVPEPVAAASKSSSLFNVRPTLET